MQTVELAPALWSDYFATVTREEAGSLALVQAGSGAVADASGGTGARPLRAISFDAARCVIEVDVGGLSAARPAVRYYVEAPRRVMASRSADSRGMEILGTDGLRTVVWLERPPVIRSVSPVRSSLHRPSFGERRCRCAR
jgi:hypothetical protein